MSKDILKMRTFRTTESFWRKLQQWQKKHAPAATVSDIIRQFISDGMKK